MNRQEVLGNKRCTLGQLRLLEVLGATKVFRRPLSKSLKSPQNGLGHHHQHPDRTWLELSQKDVEVTVVKVRVAPDP